MNFGPLRPAYQDVGRGGNYKGAYRAHKGAQWGHTPGMRRGMHWDGRRIFSQNDEVFYFCLFETFSRVLQLLGALGGGDGLASQLRRYRVPGQPLLNRHQVGGVSRSPDGLFAQQEREPIRGRPTVRGKRTYGGRPGQRVEEQGTWASRTQKHSEAGYGRPVDGGAWTAQTVKRPRQQPAHPQYAT